MFCSVESYIRLQDTVCIEEHRATVVLISGMHLGANITALSNDASLA